MSKPIGERRSEIIEKKVFFGAYAIRRLLQSGKLSSSTETRNLQVDRFPSIKVMRNKYGRWDIDKHYDLNAGSTTSLSVPRLIDLIIHSFVFWEWRDEKDDATNIVFTSDRKRNEYLWLMPLLSFIELMRFVANDHPSISSGRFDKKRNEWVEWRGNGEPPW